MINIAGINSRIIYKNNIKDKANQIIKFFQNIIKIYMKKHPEFKFQPKDASAFLDIYRSNENLKEVRSNMNNHGTNKIMSMKINECIKCICKQHSRKQILCLSCEETNVDENSD